jgi:DNA polymerase-1
MGIKPEDVTKQQRYAAKAVNFGIMYGQGPHGLSATSGLDYATARDFIAKYFEVRPKLKQYIDKLRKEAEEQGYVETILGRRRLPTLWSVKLLTARQLTCQCKVRPPT